MAYNIHHGAGTDGVVDLERIAAVIRAADVDLVALNEVDRGVERTGGVDQPAELARLTGMHVVFEKNIAFQGGEYGNAILSRLPIVATQNHYLPQMRGDEQRGVLQLETQIAGVDVTFLATHFDYRGDDAERIASVARVREIAHDLEERLVILAGDINDQPESRTVERLGTFMNDAAAVAGKTEPTYPAATPSKRIDYVFFRRPRASVGWRVRVVSAEVIYETRASDHRPVVVEFAIKSNERGRGIRGGAPDD
jgi:endonuclease/exonuclease/phosphatase family metal-dependent hydrolase